MKDFRSLLTVVLGSREASSLSWAVVMLGHELRVVLASPSISLLGLPNKYL